ncbi:MAG: excinuclease ABC subunit A [Candidatus Puniceispirillum sp.]|nr:excinuclease ABC subunit A [Candidatus Pelagibacter sp.]MBA4282728.1 excinuclease ABC subunit A [Candidatus Puniceispirillum sp.]
MKKICVKGAREHNLKNINVEIPKDQLVVITGLSGSGKSSLAFDTLYAEGQRRYVESLSAYARQFLELMEKPDVDSIEGLSPAISIEQKTTSKNPRSTVGTVTEIYDYMRLLYARVGVPYSPATGKPIEAQTVMQMVDRVMEWPEKIKLIIMAPIAREQKGEFKKEIQDLVKKGFQRIRIDGFVYDLSDAPALDKNKKHSLEIIIDRCVTPDFLLEEKRDEFRIRLSDSFETALNLSQGLVIVERLDTNENVIFSSLYSCPESGFSLEKIEPRMFSFNSPQGACKECSGLGIEVVFDEERIIPNNELSLSKGAIQPWSEESKTSKKGGFVTEYYHEFLKALCDLYQESFNTPYKDLSADFKKIVLYGSGKQLIPLSYHDGFRSYDTQKKYEGIIPYLKRKWHDTESDWVRENLAQYQIEKQCSSCSGARLKPESLCVKINDQNIAQINQFSILDALQWFKSLEFTPQKAAIAEKILKEISDRLTFLVNVGLSYLNLSRTSATLSGGESQRIRLASQIGSGLTGVMYVLDEPSIGLHQRDNDKLIETLKNLRNMGNSVIVVEHDEDTIREADYLIDMGPGAGINGGFIVAEGTVQEVLDNSASLTAQYLNGKRGIAVPTERRLFEKEKILSVKGASSNNLKNIDVNFPLSTFTCVTGVSGGGKSTLVMETLLKGLLNHVNKSKNRAGICTEITGLQLIDKVIDIDQSPIGRTPRSNPATYVGFFTAIREWFAALPEAKMRGYQPGRFSFNVKGGRCESCQGDGVLKIEMHFLPDVYVTCDQCQGKRYNRETLDIVYKGKTIADVLDLSVDEAVSFFSSHNAVLTKCVALQEVGLGYIKLGQAATTLSGGEAQRVKLSKELSKRSTGRTVYILDEPTTGLHFEDIRKLLEVLHRLVEQGNTVIVIEHNLEVIKTADWIIDLGPEGGDGGGEIIAEGTPEEVALVQRSHTAKFLKPYLKLKNKKVS